MALYVGGMKSENFEEEQNKIRKDVRAAARRRAKEKEETGCTQGTASIGDGFAAYKLAVLDRLEGADPRFVRNDGCLIRAYLPETDSLEIS